MKPSADRVVEDALVLVDKPTGCTSHDVVQRLRRIIGQKRIGHCGTLDPGATGLLVMTLGRATRLTRFLIQAPKIYEGEIRFGVSTDTYDALGEVVEEQPIDDLSAEAILDAMPAFVGTYEQVAPSYSAKKHEGRKFYEMARKGDAARGDNSPSSPEHSGEDHDHDEFVDAFDTIDDGWGSDGGGGVGRTPRASVNGTSGGVAGCESTFVPSRCFQP